MRISDWSSDVGSSDLLAHVQLARRVPVVGDLRPGLARCDQQVQQVLDMGHGGTPVQKSHSNVSACRNCGGRLLPRSSSEPAPTRRPSTIVKSKPRPTSRPTPSRLSWYLPLSVRTSWRRSEEHTSELQSLMRISYDVFC